MPITRTPQLLQRCVSGVSDTLASDHGGPPTRDDVSRAFAICTAQGQRYGKYEPGTRTLTPRGRGITSHLGDERRSDLRRFERTLNGASGAIDLEPSQVIGAVIGSFVIGGLAMHLYKRFG
jgi:hypothetical protein